MEKFIWFVIEKLCLGLFPSVHATEKELLVWRRFIATLVLVSLIMSFGNAAYSFGYLGFSGFADQQSVTQLIINDLREQIGRVTIRWCVARQMNNEDAFKFAAAELRRLEEQYQKVTGGQRYSPTCMELLING